MKTTPPGRHNHFGFTFVDDELLQRAHTRDTAKNSPSSRMCLTLEATKRRLKGAFIILINSHPAFTSADAMRILENTQNEGVHKEISIIIAPEKKLSLKDVRKAANDCGSFAPTTKWDDTPIIAEEEEDPPFLDREQTNQLNTTNGTNATEEDIN